MGSTSPIRLRTTAQNPASMGRSSEFADGVGIAAVAAAQKEF